MRSIGMAVGHYPKRRGPTPESGYAEPVSGFEPAAFLLRAGFLTVRLPLDFCGFRPVLARDWHTASRCALPAWELLCHSLTSVLQVSRDLDLSVVTHEVPVPTFVSGMQRAMALS
jgi:hypothetical protein